MLNKIQIIFSLIFVILGCHNAVAAEISFETDVQIKKSSQTNFETVKSGQVVELTSGENIFVITSQNIPLLVYAIQKDSSKLTIADSNISAALQEQLQPNLQKATVEIVEGLRKAEGLIQKRDLSQASTIVSGLKEKYKNISSVLFMSGTIYFLMNNKSSAIEDLEKGLRFDPNNEPAKKLLAKLKGAP